MGGVLVQDFHKFNQVPWIGGNIMICLQREVWGSFTYNLVDHQVAVAGTCIIANISIDV